MLCSVIKQQGVDESESVDSEWARVLPTLLHLRFFPVFCALVFFFFIIFLCIFVIYFIMFLSLWLRVKAEKKSWQC